jgi:hypothetical protein
LAGWQAHELEGPGVVGTRHIGRIDHQHVGLHELVNVAVDEDGAGLAEGVVGTFAFAE